MRSPWARIKRKPWVGDSHAEREGGGLSRSPSESWREILKGSGIGADIVAGRIAKSPGKHSFEGGQSVRRKRASGIESGRRQQKALNLVEADDMIDMVVGVENVVDLGEAFPERLFAKIGPSVDQGP